MLLNNYRRDMRMPAGPAAGVTTPKLLHYIFLQQTMRMITDYRLQITDCKLQITDFKLMIERIELMKEPFTISVCLLPFAFCQLHIAYYQLLQERTTITSYTGLKR